MNAFKDSQSLRAKKIENALDQKNEAVNLIESIRFSHLSGYEYRTIRDALESMASLLEDDLYL